MRLELYQEDLKPEHAEVNCPDARFEHFSEDVQTAISFIGQATFLRRKGTCTESYNVIKPL